jgi:hypothetical protein
VSRRAEVDLLSTQGGIGLVLEEVDTGGWCASKLGVGPEYPGPDESAECASWSVLHWISSLD